MNEQWKGQGDIWLDDVRCEGTEHDLDTCEHPLWGLHDCSHDEDVAIQCVGSLWPMYNGRYISVLYL